MTLELARRLLATGAIAARDVEAALYLSVVRGVSLARALVDRGVLSERALEEELSRRAGLPLRQVHPDAGIVARLPRGMCRMLAAVPLRADAATGTVELAAVDTLDGQVAAEFSFHLGAPVRVQRATMAAIEEAIRRLELAEGGAVGRSRRRTPAFPHGAPESVPPSPPPVSNPSEDMPFPLIKRLSTPQFSDAPPEDEPLDTVSEDTVHDGGGADEPSANEDNEALVARPPARSATPSVSFPSAPPPPGGLPEMHSLAAPEAPVGEDEPTPIDDHPTPLVDGPEPETIPRTKDAGWSPSLPELLDLIGRARGRDDLLDLVLRAVTLVAQRGALFVVRKEGFTGWSCNPAFGSEEDLRTVVIPTSSPSVLATSGAAGFYLGPIPQTPVHKPLLEVMGRASTDVAVYVAKVRARPAIVVVADELDDTLLGTRALGEITKRAGDSLTRLLGQK